MKWTNQMEQRLLCLKAQGASTQEIAVDLGVTPSSVKHKFTRLQQSANRNSHHHPIEKTSQVERVLAGQSIRRVLETHAGYGNLTRIYSGHAGEVLAYDIDADKCRSITEAGLEGVTCEQRDSLRETYRMLYQRETFDVVDVDPYGFPSRYFPNVLELIDNGFLFVTFPKYGCAQINRITQMHVKTFYDFDGGNNDEFLKKCLTMLETSARRTYREIEVLDVLDLGKVYRVAAKVRKQNAFKLCGYDHLAKKEATT